MTRIMYDALPDVFHTIPADAQLVAGYVDGAPGFPVMTPELWALYPNALHVPIATQAATNDGLALDVERFDALPDQAPGWVTMRRQAGVAFPWVYMNESTWQSVRDAFAAAGVAEPLWWVANTVNPGELWPGAIAHQYGQGPADAAEPTYDLSAVADYIPGLDPIPTPPPPPGSEASVLATAVTPDGTVYVFTVGDDDTVYANKLAPGSPTWAGWGSLGGKVRK